MARGWESKSVEDQIESAAASRHVTTRDLELTAAEIQLSRAKENLELSRTRVTRELAASANPRYRELLRKALADLDAKLALLEPRQKARAAAV
jgi:hypothetical protein